MPPRSWSPGRWASSSATSATSPRSSPRSFTDPVRLAISSSRASYSGAMSLRRSGIVPLLVLAAAVGPSAAFDVPQSREEFVKAVAAGKGATTSETFTVDQGIDGVYKILLERSSACLDVTVKRSGWVGGYVEASSSDYNPTVKKVGAQRVEFALQVVHVPRGVGEKAPPGGLYVMAADVTPLGKGRSQV